jgi:hypothetical protein
MMNAYRRVVLADSQTSLKKETESSNKGYFSLANIFSN